MKTKIKKILVILLTVLLLLSLFYTTTATVSGQFSGKNVKGEESGEKITTILATILEMVRNTGVGLAILMLIILGCKYMMASAGDKADIKKHAVAYVVGAIVLFAASAILEILKNFALDATGS